MGSKKAKLTPFEIVWYSLTGALTLWGLTYIVLGLVAAFYPATDKNNPLASADKVIADTFGLGFLYWGLIIMGIGVVCLVFVLCIKAKSSDREVEKAQRRAARLNAAAAEIVDAKVEPKAE